MTRRTAAAVTIGRVEKRARIVVAALAVMLAVPASAAAATCQAPPGSAGVAQYCEAIPGPGGSKPAVGFPQATVTNGASPAISAEVHKSLIKRGPDGAAVLRLVNGEPGLRVRATAGGHPSGPSRHDEELPASPLPAGDPPSAISGALSSFSTAGSGLGGVLIAIALVMAVFGVIAARGRRTPAEPLDN
jgi:hypothetical protein